jgi:hypothetical protein
MNNGSARRAGRKLAHQWLRTVLEVERTEVTYTH